MKNFKFILILTINLLLANNLSGAEAVNFSSIKWVTTTGSRSLFFLEKMQNPTIVPQGLLLEKYKMVPITGSLHMPGTSSRFLKPDNHNQMFLSGCPPLYNILSVDTLQTFSSSISLENSKEFIESFKRRCHFPIEGLTFEELKEFHKLSEAAVKLAKILDWPNFYEFCDLFIATLTKDTERYFYHGKKLTKEEIKEELSKVAFVLTAEEKTMLMAHENYPLLFATSDISFAPIKGTFACKEEILLGKELSLKKDITHAFTDKDHIEDLQEKLAPYDIKVFSLKAYHSHLEKRLLIEKQDFKQSLSSEFLEEVQAYFYPNFEEPKEAICLQFRKFDPIVLKEIFSLSGFIPYQINFSMTKNAGNMKTFNSENLFLSDLELTIEEAFSDRMKELAPFATAERLNQFNSKGIWKLMIKKKVKVLPEKSCIVYFQSPSYFAK